MLNSVQIKFANPAACRAVSPYDYHFWDKMQNLLEEKSEQAQSYPKSRFYRRELEPFLHKQVLITADHWSIAKTNGYTATLLLTGVRLINVKGDPVGLTPNLPVDHIHIITDAAWLASVAPRPDQRLRVHGILYEYVSNDRRNIGVCAVTITPQAPPIARPSTHEPQSRAA